MDLSDVTGPFGRFQLKILLVLLIRPICWAMLTMNYQFINQKTPFRCSNAVNSAINEFDSECMVNTSDNKLVQCYSFEYSSNQTYTTITEDWDLVCSRQWMISFGYMVFAIGNFIAYIPSGQLADKIGRRPLMLMGQGIMTLISLIIAFSTSMPMFLTLRFFIGIGFGLAQTSLFAAYVESVGPEYRDYIVYSFAAMWGFGAMAVSLIAWLVQEWKILVLVSSISFQLPLLIAIYFLVPESTRWLLATKRYDRAEKQLKMQAKLNGKEIDDIKPIMVKLKEKIELDDNADHASFINLWKNKHLRKVVIILYISFISTVFINHGFAITITLESGNLYVNLALAGLAEVPTVLFYYITVKYFNRRQGLLVSFIVTGIVFLSVIPVGDDILWLKLTLALVGRMTNSLAYSLIYVFANELFPTNLRAVAVSGAMTSGRIGSILCPLADLLGRYYGKSIPLILYGGLSLATSAIFLLLPETQHKHLPDTVHDFEKLVSNKVTTEQEMKLEEIDPKGENLI